MTAAQIQELEKALHADAIREEQHAISRRLAVQLYAQVQGLIDKGVEPKAIYDYLDQRFLEYRDNGQVVERDALVEVLDELEHVLAA